MNEWKGSVSEKAKQIKNKEIKESCCLNFYWGFQLGEPEKSGSCTCRQSITAEKNERNHSSRRKKQEQNFNGFLQLEERITRTAIIMKTGHFYRWGDAQIQDLITNLLA